jgi:uncharacterized integral membrane protein
MSASSTPVDSSSSKPVSPKRIVQSFLGVLISVLLLTLVLGQLKLPQIGSTLWELAIYGIVTGFEGLGVLIPALGDATASHYTVLTGAVGVFWLTHIYLRVSKTGHYRVRPLVDAPMLLLTAWLLVIYFSYFEKTLPLDATFFSRVALYCAISPVVFSLTVSLGYLSKVNSTNEKERHDGWMTLFVISLVLTVVCAIITGFRGGESPVSFWSYQLPNAVLHLLANIGGFAMGMWFLDGADAPAAKDKGQPEDTAAVATEPAQPDQPAPAGDSRAEER